MSRKLNQTVGGLALALGLGPACGTMQPAPPAQPTPSDPQQVSSAITASLDRLRALQVVEVGQLVLQLPAEATACYGIPCPGSTWQPVYNQERAHQATRLEKLATVAEQTMHNAYLTPHAASEADAAVQALAGLQIVEVYGLVKAQPQNNASCYNLPCPADRQAADQKNAERVTLAFGIADIAKKNGL